MTARRGGARRVARRRRGRRSSAGAPHAHDPFEITHRRARRGDRLNLHTTLSLLTATRACFRGQAALRRLAPADFAAAWPALEACARDFYRVTAGGEALPVLAARWR